MKTAGLKSNCECGEQDFILFTESIHVKDGQIHLDNPSGCAYFIYCVCGRVYCEGEDEPINYASGVKKQDESDS